LYFPIFHEDKVQGRALHYTTLRTEAENGKDQRKWEKKMGENVGKENRRESGKK
jgi:hypothetical protein